MVYFLDKNPRKQEMIKQLEEKRGLKAFTVMPKAVLGKDTRRCGEACVYPKVEQWLKGFADSDFVLTDSFHGMVFSIIFEKPFVVVANKQRGMSRFVALLSLLGLEDRLILDSEEVNFENISTNIDFADAKRRLSELKNLSLQFLTSNLEN